jgi:transposase
MIAQFASPVCYVGADISKDTIELNCLGFKVPDSVKNNPEGLGALLKCLSKSQQNVHVICEATGHYGSALVQRLHQAGILVSVLNPRLPRDFAKSRNKRAKTDKIDAALLAQYGQRMSPEATPKPEEHQLELDCLVKRRAQLVEARAKEKTILLTVSSPQIKSSINEHIQCLDKLIKELEKKIAAHIESHPDLKKKAATLSQVKGVALQTAATLLATLPELGKVDRTQITSLAGLAPFNQDSGQFHGKRCIAGGRAEVRCALYMAAISASQHNAVLKPVYQDLLKRGKEKKVALVAVMRRLLVHLNSLLKKHFLDEAAAALQVNLA